MSLLGCSLINTFYDDHNVFVRARNSEVGKKFDKVLKSDKYYDYWKGNEHYYGFKKYTKNAIDSAHTEYFFDSGSCQWALKVENKSNKVVSWRFIGDRSNCGYKRFYEGPF